MKHFTHTMAVDGDIGLEGWRDVMLKLARIVTKYPKFLPLYERAEREFLMRQAGATVLERAMRLAGAQIEQQPVQQLTLKPTIDR